MSTIIVREYLDRQIHQIQDEILLLGNMVEHAMQTVIEALATSDVEAARRVYENDLVINGKRFAIENAILIVIATQQPIAHDLRLLAAMLEIITELERMGDYAKGIAKIIIRLDNKFIPMPIQELTEMSNKAVSMLHRGLKAFINENYNQAIIIPREDDEVDDLYNQVYRLTTKAMIENPESIDDANYIMWIAHNIERMADRVTNICERTVFIATGELFEMDINDDEDME